MSNQQSTPRPERPEIGRSKIGNRKIRNRSSLTILVLLIATLAGHVLSRQGGGGGVVVTPLHPALAAAAVGTALTLPAVGDPWVRFSGRLDRAAVLQGGDGLVRLELALEAAESAPAALTSASPSTDLVVLLDRSSSMAGEKIVHARSAIDALIDQLTPADRFALVAWSDDARLAIPLTPASAESRSSWRRLVAEIAPGGGTDMSSGLDLADRLLSRRGSRLGATRVILISDGQANQGDSSPEGLSARAARFARAEINLSAVGVGEGFNEFLMSALADAGTGNFYYVDDPQQLAGIFTQEFEAGRTTVARAVAVEIEPAAGVEVVDAGGYPLERRQGGVVAFHPGSLFAGQQRQIWVTFKVSSQQPASLSPARLRTTYSNGERRRELRWQALPQIACVRDQERFMAAVDKETWARSLSDETFNQLQQRVAQYVSRGQRQEALQEISGYREHNERMNRTLQAPGVEQTLRQAEELAVEVEAAFEGEAQAYKQNVLSKKKLSSALDARRGGSKKSDSKKSQPPR